MATGEPTYLICREEDTGICVITAQWGDVGGFMLATRSRIGAEAAMRHIRMSVHPATVDKAYLESLFESAKRASFIADAEAPRAD